MRIVNNYSEASQILQRITPFAGRITIKSTFENTLAAYNTGQEYQQRQQELKEYIAFLNSGVWPSNVDLNIDQCLTFDQQNAIIRAIVSGVIPEFFQLTFGPNCQSDLDAIMAALTADGSPRHLTLNLYSMNPKWDVHHPPAISKILTSEAIPEGLTLGFYDYICISEFRVLMPLFGDSYAYKKAFTLQFNEGVDCEVATRISDALKSLQFAAGTRFVFTKKFNETARITPLINEIHALCANYDERLAQKMRSNNPAEMKEENDDDEASLTRDFPRARPHLFSGHRDAPTSDATHDPHAAQAS